jgi:hypothetical protein
MPKTSGHSGHGSGFRLPADFENGLDCRPSSHLLLLRLLTALEEFETRLWYAGSKRTRQKLRLAESARDHENK